MTYDEFKAQLTKLRQIRVDLPVIIFDPDMNEYMEVAKVSLDDGQLIIVTKRN